MQPYKTTPRIATCETSFALSYKAKAVIPTEMGLPSPRAQNFILKVNNEEMRYNLDMLDQNRDETIIRMAKYKELVGQYYNTKVQ